MDHVGNPPGENACDGAVKNRDVRIDITQCGAFGILENTSMRRTIHIVKL